MLTFKVHDLEATRRPRSMRSVAEAIRAIAAMTPQACSAGFVRADWSGNALFGAVLTAWNEHRALILTPDAVWFAIAQGLCAHINHEANAERFRAKFVTHEGQKTITIRRDDFIFGSAMNDWPGVFMEFTRRVGECLVNRAVFIPERFSTTGPLEALAHSAALLEMTKSYFQLRVMTLCGFPEIRLMGTVDDWRDIVAHISAIRALDLDLDWWFTELYPVLCQFVNAAAGQPDLAFWRRAISVNEGSGGATATGWINTLFPYVKYNDQHVRNPVLKWTTLKPHQGLRLDAHLSSLARVPFIWEMPPAQHNMQLLAGYVGVAQADDGAVSPMPGWAVYEVK